MASSSACPTALISSRFWKCVLNTRIEMQRAFHVMYYLVFIGAKYE